MNEEDCGEEQIGKKELKEDLDGCLSTGEMEKFCVRRIDGGIGWMERTEGGAEWMESS